MGGLGDSGTALRSVDIIFSPEKWRRLFVREYLRGRVCNVFTTDAVRMVKTCYFGKEFAD